jgi:hypothetical protein
MNQANNGKNSIRQLVSCGPRHWTEDGKTIKRALLKTEMTGD